MRWLEAVQDMLEYNALMRQPGAHARQAVSKRL